MYTLASINYLKTYLVTFLLKYYYEKKIKLKTIKKKYSF